MSQLLCTCINGGLLGAQMNININFTQKSYIEIINFVRISQDYPTYPV